MNEIHPLELLNGYRKSAITNFPRRRRSSVATSPRNAASPFPFSKPKIIAIRIIAYRKSEWKRHSPSQSLF